MQAKWIFLSQHMMPFLSKTKQPASFVKHFVDQKYKNASAITEDTPQALAKFCDSLAKNGVRLSYMRTHYLVQNQGQNAGYKVDFSYRTESHSNFQATRAEIVTHNVSIQEEPPIKVPWFPLVISDLNHIGLKILETQQSMDHTQFTDVEYRKRRDSISLASKEYKMADTIPHIEYTAEESAIWRQMYTRLNQLQQKAMCSRFVANSITINKQLKAQQAVPQLRDISDYLFSRTGFRFRPTHGIVTWREFLNTLAFRTFCTTQYIRNPKNIQFSPEPDICHEFSHVPMLVDPDIAKMSHKLGLWSLGAPDEEIDKMGAIYWSTIETGVCRQNGRHVAYGAAIASSIAQMENMLSPNAKFQKLNTFCDSHSPYLIQSIQRTYRVSDSFETIMEDLTRYGESILKPITTIYNQKTKEIDYDRCIEGIHKSLIL